MISWALIGFAMLLGAFLLGPKADDDMDIGRILNGTFSFWSGIILLSWSALTHFLKLFG